MARISAPAFPWQGSISQSGMTLRDYFAGQALAGLVIVNDPTEGNAPSHFARWAYALADAMLQERKNDGPDQG